MNGDVKQNEPDTLKEATTVADDLVTEPESSQDSTPVTFTHDDLVTEPESSQDLTPLTVTHDDVVMDHSSTLQVEKRYQDELSTCNTMSLMMSNKAHSIIDRNVAMYLLKLKEVHYLSQAAIDCVVSGTKSLLEQHLALVKGEVDMQLQQAQSQGAEDIHVGVSSIFEDVHDHFARLNSAYMQEKYFRDNFHLVVSCIFNSCFKDHLGHSNKSMHTHPPLH